MLQYSVLWHHVILWYITVTTKCCPTWPFTQGEREREMCMYMYIYIYIYIYRYVYRYIYIYVAIIITMMKLIVFISIYRGMLHPKHPQGTYGRFSKVHGLNVLPDPGIFELSEGILKWKWQWFWDLRPSNWTFANRNYENWP